jgi:hypothetical protein
LITEDVAVEKQQCAERLVLRRRCDVLLNGERRQELGDLRAAHFRRVALAVERNEPPDPRDVGLLGAPAVAPDTDGVAHALEQSR